MSENRRNGMETAAGAGAGSRPAGGPGFGPRPVGGPGFGPRPGGGPGGGPPGMFMGAKVKAKNIKGTIRRVWDYLRKDTLRLIIVTLLVLLGSGMQIAGPVLMGKAIDAMATPLLDGSGLTGVDFTALWTQVLLLGATYVMGTVATWGQMWLMVRVSQNAVRSLRADLFARIQQLPLRYFDSRPHGELMSRLTNDVENLNNVLTQNATQLISSAEMLIGTLAVMLF